MDARRDLSVVRQRKKILVLFGDLVLAANIIWVTAVVTNVGSPAVPLILFASLPFAFYVVGLYELDPVEYRSRPLLQVAVACVLLAIGVSMVDVALHRIAISRRFLLGALMGIPLVIVPWRLLYRRIDRKLRHLRVPVVVLGNGQRSTDLIRLVNESDIFDMRALIPGPLDDDAQRQVLDPLSDQWARDIASFRAAPPTVVLTDASLVPTGGYTKLLQLRRQGLRVTTLPQFWEEATGRLPVSYLSEEWIALYSGILPNRGLFSRVKRVMDVLGSIVLGIALGVPTLLAAVALWVNNPGPVFFRQIRVGRNGEPFSVLKLRTMKREKSGSGDSWTVAEDPRVTFVGRFVRKYRLDEVPQLWNVMKGEMSLVGPRPEAESLARMYEEAIPHYTLRQLITPGLTGWAQVCFPNTSSVDGALRKLEYDLYYIHRMGPVLDMRILLKTVHVVLFGRS